MISCFCILSRFCLNFLSISCPMLLIVFIFFSSALHLFKKPERPPNPLTLFAIRETSKPGFLWKTKSVVAGRYKERIVIVVRPETLAFCFITWWRKRFLQRFQEKTESNQVLSPKGASLWGAQRKNDPLCPNASNFKGAQFRISFA